MTESELHRKLDQIDRLLNDPDTTLEPGLVWTLLDEVAAYDQAQPGSGTPASI